MYFTKPGALNYSESVMWHRVGRARRFKAQGELGASAIEWVLISAVLVLIVGVVGTTIWTRLRDKAEGLQLDTPPAP